MAQFNAFALQDWSDPVAFDWSHPKIRGYGELSDSLKTIYPEQDFYEFNGTYYAIDTWADYYNWFTKKFWYRFTRPVGEYEAYYLIGDNQFMMEYVFNAYDYDKWEVDHPEIRRNGNQIIFNSLILNSTLIQQLNSDRLESVAYTPNSEAINRNINTGKSRYAKILSNDSGVYGSISGRSGSGSNAGSSTGSGSSGTSNVGKSIGN